ncbi:MAG: Cof-type HAD-IIB family hydrolase [Oscillospiraceae bacterium]|nr:Cof-type HAD-IIB family hydrolase [Oscillospiraceae bacterium]
MADIKAIILDIDGVIVGKKHGINSPMPNKKVAEILKKINEQGISVSLCGSRPSFAIKKIIEYIGLDSMHVTNGGSIVFNPIAGMIIREELMDKELLKKLVVLCDKHDIYLELHTKDQYYYMKKSKVSDVTAKREQIITEKVILVDNLEEAISKSVVQCKLIAKDDKEKERVTDIFMNANLDLSLNWTFNPKTLPIKIGDVLTQGISKTQGLLDIADYLGVSTENMLGVGDCINDWNFMKLCKYKAAMGNATEELKKEVLNANGYIGKTVDEDGIIGILDYFLK